MYRQDTIAAVATPAAESGVAIVRVSGPDAARIATALFVRSRGMSGELKSHKLYHGRIRDPGTKRIIDEVLLTVMRKPHSYTGEDVVEVHCHGGVFLVREVLGLLISLGARHAEPGEFTRRAFLNGRMDLCQAEAVLDLIQARTEKSAQLAFNQVSGELSKWVRDLRESLLDILVQLEAAIDFPEEEIELLEDSQLITNLRSLRKKINAIIDTYNWGRLMREGARVCICGRPNVGKSSLLNALLGDDRVIVTPEPGTTRDVIEEAVSLDSLPVILGDTAGIRASDNPVEKIGVELSLRQIAKSDAVMVVLDGSVALAAEDIVCLQATAEKRSLIVINKCDLPAQLKLDDLIGVAGSRHRISASAKSGEGLDKVRAMLRELLIGTETEAAMALTNVRHKAALSSAEQSLAEAVESLRLKVAPELVAINLHAAKEKLEEIIGVICDDDILERIFNKFCIGK